MARTRAHTPGPSRRSVFQRLHRRGRARGPHRLSAALGLAARMSAQAQQLTADATHAAPQVQRLVQQF